MSLQDIITKGSTDRSVTIRIIDSTDSSPETAVEYDTSGIDLWYRREGAVKTSITEAALAALTTAHADGGIEHIADGIYRLDLPDAAFATGAEHVDYGGTITGMVVFGGRVRLSNFDLETGISSLQPDADHTWSFDSGNQTTAPNIVYGVIGDVIGVAMDFTRPMNKKVDIDTISSVALAAVTSGTPPVASSTAKSADAKKANTILTTAAATAGSYIVTVTITTTDSATFIRKGKITLVAA